MSCAKPIQFILNTEQVQVTVPSLLSVLDFLREHQYLMGTKEGCRVGDCGSCMVLVGVLLDGKLGYQPMTACLMPVGELEGKHLVTIEGITGKQLTTVQMAFHDCGASQCGYCIPGFVMALSAWLLDPSRALDADGIDDAISGNLCRCTGYSPIKRAARQLAQQLQSFDRQAPRIPLLCEHFAWPDYFLDIETRLQQLRGVSLSALSAKQQGTIVAGATDLYLQKESLLDDDMPPRFLGHDTGQEPVRIINNELVIDSSISFESFFNNPLIQQALPDIYPYRKQIASWPIRCRATLGGNLCNASPIADLLCLMLALEASIELVGSQGIRSLPLKKFYLGYKQLHKLPDELLTIIRIPRLKADTYIHWEKVSKRFTLDVATLCSAIKIETNGQQIVRANLVFGGIAAIPMCLEKSNRFLKGKAILPATF